MGFNLKGFREEAQHPFTQKPQAFYSAPDSKTYAGNGMRHLSCALDRNRMGYACYKRRKF